MRDQELVEMAGKAAGLSLETEDFGETGYWSDMGPGQRWNPWNPLTDSCDALWLAITLRLAVSPRNKTVSADRWSNDAHKKASAYAAEFYDEHADAATATRRAITRAAAEIAAKEAA